MYSAEEAIGEAVGEPARAAVGEAVREPVGTAVEAGVASVVVAIGAQVGSGLAHTKALFNPHPEALTHLL